MIDLSKRKEYFVIVSFDAMKNVSHVYLLVSNVVYIFVRANIYFWTCFCEHKSNGGGGGSEHASARPHNSCQKIVLQSVREFIMMKCHTVEKLPFSDRFSIRSCQLFVKLSKLVIICF